MRYLPNGAHWAILAVVTAVVVVVVVMVGCDGGGSSCDGCGNICDGNVKQKQIIAQDASLNGP